MTSISDGKDKLMTQNNWGKLLKLKYQETTSPTVFFNGLSVPEEQPLTVR